ncbi:hypothetical protein BDY24DRAFT_195059 [Mrakia frigida]|uniref:uncharacterized protein n=1 Tax=Mrakia frigida TaxID=29902 RepID=UPI003FCC20A0
MSTRLARVMCFAQYRSTVALLKSSPSTLRRLSYTPSTFSSLPSSSSPTNASASTLLPSSNTTSSSSLPSSSSPPPPSFNPEIDPSNRKSSWNTPLIFASLIVLVGAASQTLSFLDPVNSLSLLCFSPLVDLKRALLTSSFAHFLHHDTGSR